MNLSCYILDDEYHALETLTEYISTTPGLELIGTSLHPLTALEEIGQLHPALLFLDIDMPGLNGLKFAELVYPATLIVFTTAYREYGPEAFERAVVDYLLKPISYERFLKCIQKIRQNLPVKKEPGETAAAIFVKTGIKGKVVRIPVAEIHFVTGALNYIEIFLQNQKIITYLTMGELIEQLPSADFSRIHKSHIVNHQFIQSLEPGQVKLKDQTAVPIGRVYRAGFLDKLNNSFLHSKRDHH